MMPFLGVGAIGLAVAGDRLVVSLAESTGNIWMP